MTLQEFIHKYSGKKVEFHSFSTGSYNQCVDLANQYITEVLQLEGIIGTNAQDFPSKAGNQFEVIQNTPSGVPEPGDLMIFKSTDKVGHISVFVEGDASSFTSFDQNYPSGSPCSLVKHNYKKVISWMRAKKYLDTVPRSEWEKERSERNKNWDLYKAEETAHNETKRELQIIKDELKNEREDRKLDLEKIGNVLQVPAELSKIIPAIETCVTFEEKAKTFEKKLDEERAEYEKKLKELQDKFNSLERQFNTLKGELDTLKEEKPLPVIVEAQKESFISKLLTLLKGKI